MFCRNHKFACAANFVGSSDCDDMNDCLALLVSAEKKFNVTVEYHTVRTYWTIAVSVGLFSTLHLLPLGAAVKRPLPIAAAARSTRHPLPFLRPSPILLSC